MTAILLTRTHLLAAYFSLVLLWYPIGTTELSEDSSIQTGTEDLNVELNSAGSIRSLKQSSSQYITFTKAENFYRSDEIQISFSLSENIDPSSVVCEITNDDYQGVVFKRYKCTSPVVFDASSLATDGYYTLRISATVYSYGLSFSTYNDHKFTLDSTPPTTEIALNGWWQYQAVFSFSGYDRYGISHFVCKVADEEYHYCNTPYTVYGLPIGSYSIYAKAVDYAGNLDVGRAYFGFDVTSTGYNGNSDFYIDPPGQFVGKYDRVDEKASRRIVIRNRKEDSSMSNAGVGLLAAFAAVVVISVCGMVVVGRYMQLKLQRQYPAQIP